MLTFLKHLAKLSFSIIFLTSLISCGTAQNQQNNEPLLSEDQDEEVPPTTTEIIIDGEADDWNDRPLLHEDQAGDVEGNFWDITKVYAFLNQDSLYILIESVDPAAPFVQLDLELSADSQHHLLTWQPSFAHLGQYEHSVFAVGSVLEGRIDLRELNSPETSVVISQIRIMAGDPPPSETWRSVDDFNPKLQSVAWVNEVDPALAQTNEDESSASPKIVSDSNSNPDQSIFTEPLTERIGHVWTVSGAQVEYVYRSFLQIPVGMTWGPDGFLYIGDWTGRHIVKVSHDGAMEDLGLWQTVGPLQYDGPRGVAFDSAGNLYTNNHGNIFKIDVDGNVERLPGVQGGPVGSIAISSEDEIYYTDRGGGKLLKWDPAGRSTTVLSGVPFAENLVFGLDGSLYLTQMGQGDVLKVNVDTGEYETFATDVCGFDPCFLAVDPEGDIWMRGIWHLHQFTPEGEEKPYVIDGETYPGGPINWHTSAGIAFDDRGGLWVGSYNSKLMYLSPSTSDTPDPDFSMQIVSPGLEASDLAVNSVGDVYATDLNLGRILKIAADGEVTVVLEHGNAGRASVAVDGQDNVFIGMPYGEILLLEEGGSSSHYANLHARRMVFGADDILYAVALENDRAQAIVGITGVDEYFTLATEIDGYALGNGELHISPAQDQGLYVFSEQDRLLYFLDFEGNGHLVADLKSLGGGGPAVMAASPVTGDIYLVPHGPYELYRITPEGETSKAAVGIFGDPWGMVIGEDGKFLYVAESGAINKIPIGDILP